MIRSLLWIAAGLFLLAMGVRSVSGTESDVEHLYGGIQEPIVCKDGMPIAGNGAHAPTAEHKCQEERERLRRQAPWWIAAGLCVSIYGLTRFKKARSA